MQGVVRSFDPGNGEGVLVTTDGARSEFLLAADALEGSVFRMLRQGQRVNFDVDGSGLATRVRIGAEVDMGLPPDIQV
jgi:CspA family cold shock protein